MHDKPLLLIAEDDPDDQYLIQDAILKACSPNVEARFVEDGVELITFLENKQNGAGQPDLILLDLNMPRKDGRTALREIKANPALAEIPVVVLTTSNIDDDQEFCRQLDVNGYYRKPSTVSELRAILGRLCALYLA